jgi:histidine ammonia-lyase
LVEAVAWREAGLDIAPETLAAMDRRHEAFEAFVAERVRNDPQALIYGVTSAPGDAAATALSDEGRARRPNQLWTAMSFGESLPRRVVRRFSSRGWPTSSMVTPRRAARSRVPSRRCWTTPRGDAGSS